jgi:hypothetical protein
MAMPLKAAATPSFTLTLLGAMTAGAAAATAMSAVPVVELLPLEAV